MRNESRWAQRAPHLVRIVVIGAVTAALWIPLLAFLQLPERPLLGIGGHFLVGAAVTFQVVALGVGVAVAAHGPSDATRARRGSWLWGLVAIPAAVTLAYPVTLSVERLLPQGLHLENAEWWIGVSIGAVIFSAPAFASPRHPCALSVVTALFTVAALALGSLATITYWTLPIIVGPLTVYGVALTLKNASASYALHVDPPNSAREPANRPATF